MFLSLMNIGSLNIPIVHGRCTVILTHCISRLFIVTLFRSETTDMNLCLASFAPTSMSKVQSVV